MQITVMISLWDIATPPRSLRVVVKLSCAYSRFQTHDNMWLVKCNNRVVQRRHYSDHPRIHVLQREVERVVQDETAELAIIADHSVDLARYVADRGGLASVCNHQLKILNFFCDFASEAHGHRKQRGRRQRFGHQTGSETQLNLGHYRVDRHIAERCTGYLLREGKILSYQESQPQVRELRVLKRRKDYTAVGARCEGDHVLLSQQIALAIER